VRAGADGEGQSADKDTRGGPSSRAVDDRCEADKAGIRLEADMAVEHGADRLSKGAAQRRGEVPRIRANVGKCSRVRVCVDQKSLLKDLVKHRKRKFRQPAPRLHPAQFFPRSKPRKMEAEDGNRREKKEENSKVDSGTFCGLPRRSALPRAWETLKTAEAKRR
jgi:hypothetical protein